MIKQSTITMSGANARINKNSNDNSINISRDFSSEQLRDFIDQIRSMLSQFSEENQKSMESHLTIIESEASKTKPDKKLVNSALQSIRSVIEGVSASVIAAGIVG